MKLICAWCLKELQKPDSKSDNKDNGIGANEISHGICPDCKKKVLAEVECYNDCNDSKKEDEK